MAHDIDLALSQLWFCRAICTILFTSSMCSTLFTLSMTFERFYSIIRPHKAASFNTAKKAKIIIGCIVIFSIGYNFPLWFLSSQVGESKKLQCICFCNEFNTRPDILLECQCFKFYLTIFASTDNEHSYN